MNFFKGKHCSIVFLLIAFIFSSEQVEFSVGSAKHDYSNIDFTYKGSDGFVNFSLRKLTVSTTNSHTEFSENRSSLVNFIEAGPSKILLQGLSIDLHDNYSNNNIKFDLGSVSLDVLDFDVGFRVDDYDPDPIPDIDGFNIRFKISNLKLDLSRVLNFPRDVDMMLRDIGIRPDEFNITRGSINTSFNRTNNFILNLDGYTSMGSIDIQVQAKINQQDPNKSVFQACKLVISNLSDEMKTAIENIQIKTGVVIPLKNGSISYDIKDMLNSGQMFNSLQPNRNNPYNQFEEELKVLEKVEWDEPVRASE